MAQFPGRLEGGFDRTTLLSQPYMLRDIDAAIERIERYIREALDGLHPIGLRHLVVGLSGGLDSVVAAALARNVVSAPNRLWSVYVNLGRPDDAIRAAAVRECAERLEIGHLELQGATAREALIESAQIDKPWVAINLDTRLIQTLIFREADQRDAAVICTTDRSERVMGRYTECFYGHLAPLADLYKTEVAEVATRLGVAKALTEERPGCEDYWFDDEILGAGYDLVDPILHLLTEHGLTPQEIAERFRFESVGWLERVANRCRSQSPRVTPGFCALRPGAAP